MNEQPSNEEKLRSEFEALGRNLVGAMRAAWEAPESKRLREEMVNGLNDLGVTLKREADNLASSQAAQQVKTGVEQVGDRLRAPEVQTKVRNELVSALQLVNNELQKVINRWGDKPASTPSDVPMGGEPVAQKPVPGVIDEDPFGQSVPPESTDLPSTALHNQTDDPGI